MCEEVRHRDLSISNIRSRIQHGTKCVIVHMHSMTVTYPPSTDLIKQGLYVEFDHFLFNEDYKFIQLGLQ